MGAKCEITNLPGYLLPYESEELKDVVWENMHALMGDSAVRNGSGGSTDAQDLSQIIPVVHMRIGGAKGIGHGANYEIVDKEMAYITAAKILATTAIDLLAEGAVLGQKVKDNFKAPMTKEQYLRDWGGLDL